ncbi:MAG TPA: helix-turn-helix transcriptional regulator [Vineibacter sp.]|nr:helix-turn-helix transcriptional regulator [Vineibacter sp.]
MSASSTLAPAPDNGDCAVVRFSTDDYEPYARLEAVHEILGRNLQKVHVEPLAGESFHTAITLYQVPGLALYRAARSAAIYRRSREFIEHDDVIVISGFTSSYEVQHLGRTLSMGPGESVILTGAEPAFFGGPDQKSVNLLRVPVRSLSPFVADLDAAYGRTIAADNSALRLLDGYLDILEEAGTFAVPELRRQAVSHIHDLIALAIGAARDAAETAQRRGGRAARLGVIKQDIANRLDQADLSVATIAARHRVRPRWVQRLFEREGTTFTEYVLAQRLLRAYRLLSDPRRGHLKISTVALEAGFGDLSYFNRAFRRRYGVTPSELRGTPAVGD